MQQRPNKDSGSREGGNSWGREKMLIKDVRDVDANTCVAKVHQILNFGSLACSTWHRAPMPPRLPIGRQVNGCGLPWVLTTQILRVASCEAAK